LHEPLDKNESLLLGEGSAAGSSEAFGKLMERADRRVKPAWAASLASHSVDVIPDSALPEGQEDAFHAKGVVGIGGFPEEDGRVGVDSEGERGHSAMMQTGSDIWKSGGLPWAPAARAILAVSYRLSLGWFVGVTASCGPVHRGVET
jgi:hypothetical protein